MFVILTKNNLARARATERARAAVGTSAGSNPTLKAPGPAAPSLIPDGTRDKLLKLIPGDAAIAYTIACGFSLESTYLPPTAFLLSAIVLIITIRTSGAKHAPPIKPEPMQYIVRMAAFAAWAFAIRSPLGHWASVPPWIPAIAVLFISGIGALLIGGEDPPTTEPS